MHGAAASCRASIQCPPPLPLPRDAATLITLQRHGPELCAVMPGVPTHGPTAAGDVQAHGTVGSHAANGRRVHLAARTRLEQARSWGWRARGAQPGSAPHRLGHLSGSGGARVPVAAAAYRASLPAFAGFSRTPPASLAQPCASKGLKINVAALLGTLAAGKSVWVSYFTQAGPQRLVGTVNGNVGAQQVLLRYTYKDAGARAAGSTPPFSRARGTLLCFGACTETPRVERLPPARLFGCASAAAASATPRHAMALTAGHMLRLLADNFASSACVNRARLAAAAVATWFLTQLDVGKAATIVLAPDPAACEDFDSSCSGWAATGECSAK